MGANGEVAGPKCGEIFNISKQRERREHNLSVFPTSVFGVQVVQEVGVAGREARPTPGTAHPARCPAIGRFCASQVGGLDVFQPAVRTVVRHTVRSLILVVGRSVAPGGRGTITIWSFRAATVHRASGRAWVTFYTVLLLRWGGVAARAVVRRRVGVGGRV